MSGPWTHRYQGVCDHGTLVAVMGIGSPTAPEDLAYTPRVVKSEWCGTEGCELTLEYVRSWDHEPTDEEIDAVTPPGFRDADE